MCLRVTKRLGGCSSPARRTLLLLLFPELFPRAPRSWCCPPEVTSSSTSSKKPNHSFHTHSKDGLHSLCPRHSSYHWAFWCTDCLKSRHSFGACKFSQFSQTENCPLLHEREMGISPRRAEGAKWNICSSVLLVAKINGDEKKVLIEKLIAELYFLSCVSLCAVVSSPLSKRWMTESCMHFLSLPLSLSHRYTVQLPLLLPSSLTPPSPITELNSILCCLNMTEQNAVC